MAEKYKIGEKEFKSKEKIREYITQIRDKYSDYEDVSQQDLDFMISFLCSCHPRGIEKIGRGIRRIWVQNNNPSRGFWLERIDGTRTDFGYWNRISNPISKLADFKSACRFAVRFEVENFKKDYFKKWSNNGRIICPISNEPITIEESHTDHAPPNTFDKIVNEFIEVNKIDVNSISINGYKDGETRKYFSDVKFESDWIEFHNKNASLRILSKKANLSMRS